MPLSSAILFLISLVALLVAPSCAQEEVTNKTTAQVFGFLHMHKAAGHSVCHFARAQKDKVRINEFQARRTCNMLGDGPSTTSGESLGKSCDARWAELRKDRVTFFAVERWMDPLCMGIRYMTILRDPFARLVSHANFEMTKEHMPVKTDISQALQTIAGPFQKYEMPKKHYCMWSAQTINNYYTRVLNDKFVYMLRARYVTLEHLERAKQRLAQFEVVIISEHWDLGVQLLAKAFGWNVEMHMKQVANRNQNHHMKYEEFFSLKDQALLSELNALDVTLYNDVAKPLFQEQLERFGLAL
jgi:hypothetical protein